MKGNAPNSPFTGSQLLLVMNDKPNCAMESRDFATSAKSIEPTSKTMSNAVANSKSRKIASPAFPVGDKRRRSAGQGRLFGLGVINKKSELNQSVTAKRLRPTAQGCRARAATLGSVRK